MKEEKLKKKINDLKSELEASMRREELLMNPGGQSGSIKQKVKATKLGKVAADPNSRVGKIVRSPRTIYRIFTHPSIIKDFIGEKIKKNKKGERIGGEIADIFVPVKFFYSDDCPRRVNVLMQKFDPGILMQAVQVANNENLELRVITYGEPVAQIKYKNLLDQKKIPKAKKISFYSSVDQASRKEIFMLEVNSNDIFMTLPWRGNEISKSK